MLLGCCGLRRTNTTILGGEGGTLRGQRSIFLQSLLAFRNNCGWKYGIRMCLAVHRILHCVLILLVLRNSNLSCRYFYFAFGNYATQGTASVSGTAGSGLRLSTTCPLSPVLPHITGCEGVGTVVRHSALRPRVVRCSTQQCLPKRKVTSKGGHVV